MRGGKRPGAGRPRRHGAPTTVLRVPVNEIAAIKRFLSDKTALKLPLYSSKVSAGFPSPAEDHIEKHLDLNDLIKHPAATFFVRATGHSMKEVGINHNDILIVDRSIPPLHGKVVIAVIHGQLTVKTIFKKNHQLFLMPANPEFSPIEVKEEDEIYIWGVVTTVIHDLG